ncbi:MAG: TVP38/TMEM64 family protein [Acidobacteria bacterium]|nr:MAG: TVP38/TMEM64 family protein [Acidobacteriota bacterium]REK11006.1 MAG: TVP38/TMEM64 family protein [Acidobacteriota bacterium]
MSDDQPQRGDGDERNGGSGGDADSEPRSAGWLRLLGGLAVLVALFFLARAAGDRIPAFTAWVDGLGFWGPLAFLLGYAVATVALVPGSLLTLAAGALFGIWQGTVVVFLGASLGASLAFLISRYVARRPVERRLQKNEKVAAIDRAVEREGRKIVFLLRLTPAVPFTLLNYALGLTKVRFVDYLIACLGMIPGTLLYVYYGKVAGDLTTIAAQGGVERDWKSYALLAIGLVAAIAVTTVITRIARRALADAGAERLATAAEE